MTMNPDLLKAPLEAQHRWLKARADELQSGMVRVIRAEDGADLSVKLAAEYRHRANNLESVLEGYRRVLAREQDRPR